jgi:hypothetical protein
MEPAINYNFYSREIAWLASTGRGIFRNIITQSNRIRKKTNYDLYLYWQY